MGERLHNKTALVTGSTSNIGRAIAEAFAAEGAHVIVSGRDRERAARVVEGIRAAGGRADFLAADLDGSAGASRDLAERARQVPRRAHRHPGEQRRHLPGAVTTATDEETFDRVYAVNVKAPFFLTAAVAPAMAEAGGGSIINLGLRGSAPGIRSALYSSTKGAMETRTRHGPRSSDRGECG